MDPGLGPLGDNGGATQTHALLPGSPALDAGDPAAPGSGRTACEATDQRGAPRNCDVGAYEQVLCQKVTVNRVGTEGDDVLVGTSGSDGFLALGGKDRARGLGGKDTACMGRGKDTAAGGGGRDRLKGEQGKDILKGQGGADRLKGGGGRDVCNGGPGKDRAPGCETKRAVP
jgi:Ca2+-binding RTX toxin-like protein